MPGISTHGRNGRHSGPYWDLVESLLPIAREMAKGDFAPKTEAGRGQQIKRVLRALRARDRPKK
jgi:hypothetical protein